MADAKTPPAVPTTKCAVCWAFDRITSVPRWAPAKQYAAQLRDIQALREKHNLTCREVARVSA